MRVEIKFATSATVLKRPNPSPFKVFDTCLKLNVFTIVIYTLSTHAFIEALKHENITIDTSLVIRYVKLFFSR